MQKDYRIVPRGVALVIGCNTFPTWNSYPGLFASLATGNAVVVKPHPRAVLPLAISVEAARTVLEAAGFDPALVQLAPEADGEGLAKTLAERPEVRDHRLHRRPRLRRLARARGGRPRQAGLHREVRRQLDRASTRPTTCAACWATWPSRCTLYSGQMCTTPQNIYVPRDGIDTDEGHLSFEEVGAQAGRGRHAGSPPTTPRRSSCSARRSTTTCAPTRPPRCADLAEEAGGTVGRSTPARSTHPTYPDAVVRTPGLVSIDVAARTVYTQECFGPVTFLIATDGTDAVAAEFRDTVREHGAMTAAVYSTSEDVLDAARDAAADAGVALSENLTGPVFVNQTAAFSDYHGTGANPAANSAYVDAAFVGQPVPGRHLPPPRLTHPRPSIWHDRAMNSSSGRGQRGRAVGGGLACRGSASGRASRLTNVTTCVAQDCGPENVDVKPMQAARPATSVICSIRALTTSVNRPSVRMLNGRLNSLTIGFTNALTSPKITATNRIVSSRALSESAPLPEVDAVAQDERRHPEGHPVDQDLDADRSHAGHRGTLAPRTTPQHARAARAQYSARMSDQVHLRAALRDVPAYKPGKPATAREGVTAYKISSNENPYPPLPSVLEVVQDAAAGR